MTRLLIPLAILVALAVPGCNSSPTDIDGGTMIFEGTVVSEGRETHMFTLNSEGGVLVETLSVIAIPELEVGVANLGLGVGQPLTDGECSVTYSVVTATGSRLSLGLQARTYCLVLFDNGSLTEDAQREYAVQISPAES